MKFSIISITVVLFVATTVTAAPVPHPFGFDDLIDGISDVADKVKDGVTDTADSIKEGITGAADKVADVAGDTAKTVSDVIDDTAENAKDDLKKLRQAEKAAIEGILTPATEAFKWCTSSEENKVICNVACTAGVSAIAQVAGLPGVVSKGVSAAWCSTMRVTLECILEDKGCSADELKNNVIDGTLVGIGVPQKSVVHIKELVDF